jgi:hypothetical protein
MARGGRGRDEAAPGAGAVDLGALRAKSQEQGFTGQPTGFYANDVQPTVESAGELTLFFAHIGPEGRSDQVAITLPMGLFSELVSLYPQLLAGSVERAAKQLQRAHKILESMDAEVSGAVAGALCREGVAARAGASRAGGAARGGADGAPSA